jgi:hypothetical protein
MLCAKIVHNALFLASNLHFYELQQPSPIARAVSGLYPTRTSLANARQGREVPRCRVFRAPRPFSALGLTSCL